MSISIHTSNQFCRMAANERDTAIRGSEFLSVPGSRFLRSSSYLFSESREERVRDRVDRGFPRETVPFPPGNGYPACHSKVTLTVRPAPPFSIRRIPAASSLASALYFCGRVISISANSAPDKVTVRLLQTYVRR